MARRRLFFKVAPWLVAVIGLCTGAAAWYADVSVRNLHYERTARELENDVQLAALQITPLLAAGAKEQLQPLARQLGSAARARLTVIDLAGKVWGDSEEDDPAVMDNHAVRPEIAKALRGEPGQAIRYSPTLKIDMTYVARPIVANGQVIGVIRAAMAMSDLSQTLHRVYLQITLGGAVLAVVAVFLTLVIFSRLISRPLQQLQAGAARFAAGRLDQLVPVPDSAEIGALAETLNLMAGELDEKIRAITRQSRETQAVLAGMIEAVLAIDPEQRIITLNQAAARLLGVNAQLVRGKSLFEVVRHADLQRLLDRVFKSAGPVEGELTLRTGEEDHLLEAHAAALQGSEGRLAGAVVVLHDVTRLRKLEQVRQEFVANVSHELKTPITAIKAAVETLSDGLENDPAAGRRFLPIIARHTNRLNAIVDDLLMLAQVEQKDEKQKIALARGPVGPVLQSAVEACRPKAEAKKIGMKLVTNGALEANINPALLEQAVVNLLDNAVKYCPAGCLVKVSAQKNGGEVVLAIADNGPGIDPIHLPRLFERFYRPDQDRSREVGGTGLGLSIVKHVALAHGGSAEVDSTPGVGSTFRIHLPALADG